MVKIQRNKQGNNRFSFRMSVDPMIVFVFASLFIPILLIVWLNMFFTTVRSEMNNRVHQIEKGKSYDESVLTINKEVHEIRKHGSLGGHEYSNENDIMKAYNELRKKFDNKLPPSDVNRMLNRVKSLRNEQYEPIHTFEDSTSEIRYDVFNCPEFPPENYPQAWSILDIVDNWNPDDPTPALKPKIYQGICIFNYKTDFEKALNYRNAEKPFVIRDDPLILETAERWSYPEYLDSLLGDEIKHRTEYSQNNHFMFWRLHDKKNPYFGIWEPPTENIRMSYVEWRKKAEEIELDYNENKPHWYFRLNSCSGEHCDVEHTDYLYEEVPFLKEKKSFYMVDPTEHRGINCRFGMKGNIAGKIKVR